MKPSLVILAVILLAIGILDTTDAVAQTSARRATATLVVLQEENEAVLAMMAELSFSGYRVVTELTQGGDPWEVFEERKSDVLVVFGSEPTSVQIWVSDASRNMSSKVISGEPGILALRAVEYLRAQELEWLEERGDPPPAPISASVGESRGSTFVEEDEKPIPHLRHTPPMEARTASSDDDKWASRPAEFKVKAPRVEPRAKPPLSQPKKLRPPREHVWKLGVGPSFQFSPNRLTPGTHIEGSFSWQLPRFAELEATVAGPVSKMTVEVTEGTASVESTWASVSAHAYLRTRFLSAFAGASLAITRLVVDGETLREEISVRKFTKRSWMALGSFKLESAPFHRFALQLGYRSGSAFPRQRVSVLSQGVAIWGRWIHLLDIKAVRHF